jgi:GINS complex subunit 2
MASSLKLKKKCHIVPPDWLNVGVSTSKHRGASEPDTSAEFLQEKLTQETSGPNFSRLPFRYAEIAHVLLDV